MVPYDLQQRQPVVYPDYLFGLDILNKPFGPCSMTLKAMMLEWFTHHLCF
jgi:hypothetical protein